MKPATRQSSTLRQGQRHLADYLFANPMHVASGFADFGLPVPQSGEYYKRSMTPLRPGAIVFLSRYGCTLHVRKDDYNISQRHPNLLRPIFSRSANGIHFDLFPGVAIAATYEEGGKLIKAAGKFGLHHTDHGLNMGHVPCVTPLFPILFDSDPFHTGISRRAIRKLSRRTYTVRTIINGEEQLIETNGQRVQHETYAALRRQIRKAWPKNCEHSDPDKIQKFWTTCAAWKKSDILLSPWEKMENNYHGTNASAAAYDAHIASCE